MTFPGFFAVLPAVAIMDAVEQDRPRPKPVVGEGVTDYWLRVLRFHAWEDGYDARVEDPSWDRGENVEREPNPYESPAP